MVSSSSSAKEPSPWYMDFKPMFERSYGAIENGKRVQRTERLTALEVDEIITELASNSEFMSVMREYAAIIKKFGNDIPREMDVEIGQRFTPYIDATLQKKSLKMGHFFSNSITIEVLQRIETGKIGVEN